MDNNLRDKTITGPFWTIIERFGYLGINHLVLARLLMPKVCSTVGILFVFVSLSFVSIFSSLAYGKFFAGNRSWAFEEVTATTQNVFEADASICNNAYKVDLSDHSCYGKKILDKSNGILKQSMINQANMVYVIRYDYDLNGASVNVPANSTLAFEGGSISNGTIVGNCTFFEGEVKVDGLSGSFAQVIKSSYSCKTCGLEKLSMLLTLNIDELIIDEDYNVLEKLTNETVIDSYIKNIIGTGRTLNFTNSEKDNYFIRLYGCEKLSGLKFDFNNQSVGMAVQMFDKDVTISAKSRTVCDISISNIRIPEALSGKYTYAFYINNNVENMDVVIDGVIISNVIANCDGIPNNENGPVAGLVVFNGTTTNLKIQNCKFDTILNVDSEGKCVLDDGSAIFVSNSNIVTNNSRVLIEHIYANNGGKRVIKTNCKNIIVQDVHSYNGGTFTIDGVTKDIPDNVWLAVVGLNNQDYTVKVSTLPVSTSGYENKSVFVTSTEKYYKVESSEWVEMDSNNLEVNAVVSDVYTDGYFWYSVACFDANLRVSNICANGNGGAEKTVFYGERSHIIADNISVRNASLSDGNYSSIQVSNLNWVNKATESYIHPVRAYVNRGTHNNIIITGMCFETEKFFCQCYNKINNNDITIDSYTKGELNRNPIAVSCQTCHNRFMFLE